MINDIKYKWNNSINIKLNCTIEINLVLMYIKYNMRCKLDAILCICICVMNVDYKIIMICNVQLDNIVH